MATVNCYDVYAISTNVKILLLQLQLITYRGENN